MFRGCFEHTIDSKGRLSIPAKFRDALETTFTSPLVLTRQKECLVAYPSDEWSDLESRIEGLASFNPQVQAFKRFFYSAAQECPLDSAGRILVPPTLRAFAEIDGKVVLAGMGKSFELWSKDRYDKMMSAAAADFDEIAQAMGGMGL